MFPAVFEPTIPASDRPQTLALDIPVSGIGSFLGLGLQSADSVCIQPYQEKLNFWRFGNCRCLLADAYNYVIIISEILANPLGLAKSFKLCGSDKLRILWYQWWAFRLHNNRHLFVPVRIGYAGGVAKPARVLLMESSWRMEVRVCQRPPPLSALRFVVLCRLALKATCSISKIMSAPVKWRFQIHVDYKIPVTYLTPTLCICLFGWTCGRGEVCGFGVETWWIEATWKTQA